MLGDLDAVIFGDDGALAGTWWDSLDRGYGEGVSPSLSSDGSDSQLHDSRMGPSLEGSLAPSSQSKALSATDYRVGIVCALPKEFLAVRALLDEVYDCFSQTPQHDSNHYVFGRMGRLPVVAACLPYREYGTNSAAAAVIHLRRSFTAVEFCMLVGIGGGRPPQEMISDLAMSS